MKKMYTKLLMLMAMMLVSNSLWAYTLPTGTMDLRTIKESSMGTWIDKVSYSLDDNYLIISGYASYKSANTDDKKGQTWITQTSAGNSANTWEEKEPFKGSGYYTTASYTTIQSGRNLVYRVKNCKSFSLYGKNNAAKKNLVINIFEVTDGKASTEAAYTLSNEETTEQVFSQTLDGDKEYVIDIEANGASNSRVFEVAFERSVVADTRLEPSLSISGTEFTATVGDTDFEEPTVSSSSGYKGSYSYSSDKPTVASVDSSTGEVTICGVGTATITISTEENNASYKCRSITYTITVSKARPVGATFYESFDKLEGNGGNDDVWSGINVTPALGDFDNEGWTTEGTLYSGFQCVSIRKNSDTTKPSGVTTPAIGEEGNAVVSFMAESWGTDGTNFFVDIVGDGTFAVSEGLEEGNISNEGKTAKVIMAKTGAWTTYTLNVEGVTADTKFFFYVPGNKRAFLDEVVIYVSPAPEPKTYSLVGWINGADYGCEGDWENPGEYTFDEDGKLTVNFDEDSYVFVKTTDNSKWYLSEDYVEEGEANVQVTATMANGKEYSEKMFVPGGQDIELTLTEKDDDTIELTYTMPEYEPKTYSLVGWINGANYGCEDDWENPGEYTFDPEGKLNMYFDEDSYVFVKTTDNKKWYLAEEYVPKGNPNTTVTAPMANGSGYSEKMEIPSGYDIEMTLRETGNNTIELSVNIIQPSEKVISNNEIEDYTSMGGPLMWQGRDDIGNYVTVAFDAEGNLDKKYTSIMTADFEEKYGATSGTASITTGEDGSKTLEATIRFGEYGIFHITGTIAAPVPCPFGLPTVTATTEDITFVFDLTDAVEGKDNPELEATIVVKKGEMEYTAGLSEEDVVDGKVIKTISNSIFSAGFSSLALEAGDEIVVTFPEATLWETVEGKWNKAWTGEVEGSVNVTVKAVLPTPNVKVSTTHFNLDLDLSTITEGLDDPALSTTIEVKHGAKTYIYDQIDFYDVSSGKLSLDVDNVKLIGDDEFLPEEDDKIVVTLKNACISYVDGELKSIIFADSEGVKVTVIGTDMEQVEVVENEIIKTGENSYWHAWKPERETEFYIAFDDEGNIMVNDISMRLYGKEVLGHSATGYVITNEDGSMEIEATIRFYDMPSLYRINATIAAPAPCPFGLPTVTATTEEIVITFDLADAVEGVENPTLEPSDIVINGEYHASGFGEIDVVDGKVELKIPVEKFISTQALELTEGQEITVTIDEVTLYENFTAGGYETLYEGAIEGSVQATVTTASGINTLSSASDNVVKYNLAGQRVKNAKGIIIVNGKKVAVK